MKTLARYKSSDPHKNFWWGTIIKRGRDSKTRKKTITIAYENRMVWRNQILEDVLVEENCELKTVFTGEDYAMIALVVFAVASFAFLIYVLSQ